MTLQEATKINVDWDRGAVADHLGSQTVLRAQSLAVLKVLYVRAGSLVTKDDLLTAVWQGVAVTDDSLVQCIAEIRRALNDDRHTIIRTLPKRGYILETDSIESITGSKISPTYVTTLETIGRGDQAIETKVGEHSIAVLPFANISGDQEQDYFVDGLTEDVITDLSNEPGLFVIARNTSLSYKGKPTDVRQIAFDLGVQYVLEGSVRKSARRLRINAQLSNAQEGRQLWAERFDRDIHDIFDLQDEITQRIVSSISGRLGVQSTNKQKPQDLNAYDIYLRGRGLWGVSRASCLQDISLLEQALLLEPEYAAVHAELGMKRAADWLVWSGPESTNKSAANFHSKKALEIAPDDTHVLFRRGWVALSQAIFEESCERFKKALEINSNDADSWLGLGDYHFLTGNLEASVDACARALRLNPQPPAWYFLIVSSALIGAEKFQEAINLMENRINNIASSRRFLAVALAKQGRIEEARHQAALFAKFDPNWSAAKHTAKRAFKSQKDRAWWLDAYEKAGLPA